MLKRLQGPGSVAFLVLPDAQEAVHQRQSGGDGRGDHDGEEAWAVARGVFGFEEERAEEVACTVEEVSRCSQNRRVEMI